ncbi:MAG: phosphopentomutase, partial [Deltaproteobacteria bacterium]|nr:phosphopentomutase [Deltaproteobacteria bacterium]
GGRMQEASPAKDTVTGHWEIAGLVSRKPFALYPNGFPLEIMAPFEKESGFSTLYNRAASGTVILEQLGEEHMATGRLIVYTSADSVFQIAAHEEIVPLPELYRACEVARKILDPFHVARVIARPFVGRPGSFDRTYNRKDFCMEPPSATLLDRLTAAGIPVTGVGKIEDIFAGRGVTHSVHTEGNRDGFDKTLDLVKSDRQGLIFVNLVDYDMVFGHRRNAQGYARALEEGDEFVGRLLPLLTPDDVLIITADHGCDPSHAAHTDHTREFVPLLVYAPGLPMGRDLGVRNTFADVAATTMELFGLRPDLAGVSVLRGLG